MGSSRAREKLNWGSERAPKLQRSIKSTPAASSSASTCCSLPAATAASPVFIASSSFFSVTPSASTAPMGLHRRNLASSTAFQAQQPQDPMETPTRSTSGGASSSSQASSSISPNGTTGSASTLLASLSSSSSSCKKRMEFNDDEQDVATDKEKEPFLVRAKKPRNDEFHLDAEFLAGFANQKAPFGFNGLGELVYRRTYARVKADGLRENWHETVARVVNGTFDMQKSWLLKTGLGWDQHKAQQDAQEMYRRIFHMKFLPPGRGLWAMGTKITKERGLFAALNNCAFVSTEDMGNSASSSSSMTSTESPSDPFCFLMDAAMLGVGVGFDTKGAGRITVQGPDARASPVQYLIPDSREGWVESVRMQLDSYFLHKPRVEFDYSAVRAAGTPIRGFGGVSSGPRPLMDLHVAIEEQLSQVVGQPLPGRTIVNLMNLVGVCVVSGNVRRTAEIAFGDPDDQEYIDLKDYAKNPDRAAFGWTSNNSIFAKLGMDYEPICKRIVDNGEPGFAWLDNMRNYGRMNGVRDDRDKNACGGNPCLEQTLESYEMCCLVETFPAHHDSLEDFIETLRYAFMYAKTVTLGPTHWPRTNRVMMKNRRIGCSMSGIAQFVSKHGLHEFQQWCERGYDSIQQYDEVFSNLFAIPRSIKTTSIKPSGTVSLLAGATPGIHFPESRFYIRRMRLPKDSELVEPLEQAGYDLEPACENPQSTLVVSIPVDVGDKVRTLGEVTFWEQMSMAAFVQRHWADNQVSCTVTFDRETEGPQLKHALDFFQYQLKGISLLPKLKTGKGQTVYKQMPYEEIDEATYHQMQQQLKPLNISSQERIEDEIITNVPDKFCDNDQCQV